MVSNTISIFPLMYEAFDLFILSVLLSLFLQRHWLISIPLYFSQSGVRLYTFPRNDTHKSSTVLWTATSFGVKYFGRPIFSQNWFRKLGLLTSTSKPEVIWLLLRNEKILFLPKLSVHCSICKLKMMLKIKLLYIYYNFANLGKFQVKFS